MKNTHINVTIDFSLWNGQEMDLRVPGVQPARELIENLGKSLGYDTYLKNKNQYALKEKGKEIVLLDYETLVDRGISDGAFLEIV